MPPRPERRWLRVLAGYTILVGLVMLLAFPVSLGLGSERRPVVIRLAAGVVLAIALIHLVRSARQVVDAQPPSPFDRALRPLAIEPSLDQRFTELRDQLGFAAASQSHFSRVLWPTLLTLADPRAGRRAPEPPARPLGRWLLRRGPSLAALREAIAALEERA